MPIDLEVARRFFVDNIGKVMIITGVVFLGLTVPFLTATYQLYSIAFLLLGVFLIVVGTVVHFESFQLKIPSLDGWGTISICASAMLITLAVAFALYAVPGEPYILPAFQKAGGRWIAVYYNLYVTLVRPNLWLTPILLYGGIALFAFGIFLKFFRDIF